MEFLLIGESKLKIVVDEEDVKKYGLESCASSRGGAAFRRSFWQILDLAKLEVGFDPSGDKLLIQFYPIKSGGCEIFVTKLGILPESSARMVSRSNRVSMVSKNKSFYGFSSLERLFKVAASIKKSAPDVSVVSDVYLLDDKYYLMIEEYGKGGDTMEFPCILEYGEDISADFGLFVSEHAVKLTDGDGIDIFSNL